jgi:hypothetical protein
LSELLKTGIIVLYVSLVKKIKKATHLSEITFGGKVVPMKYKSGKYGAKERQSGKREIRNQYSN